LEIWVAYRRPGELPVEAIEGWADAGHTVRVLVPTEVDEALPRGAEWLTTDHFPCGTCVVEHDTILWEGHPTQFPGALLEPAGSGPVEVSEAVRHAWTTVGPGKPRPPADPDRDALGRASGVMRWAEAFGDEALRARAARDHVALQGAQSRETPDTSRARLWSTLGRTLSLDGLRWLRGAPPAGGYVLALRPLYGHQTYKVASSLPPEVPVLVVADEAKVLSTAPVALVVAEAPTGWIDDRLAAVKNVWFFVGADGVIAWAGGPDDVEVAWSSGRGVSTP